MPKFRVSGFEKIAVWGYVEAETEKEAITAAWRNEWDDLDSDPIGQCDRRKWSAEQVS